MNLGFFMCHINWSTVEQLSVFLHWEKCPSITYGSIARKLSTNTGRQLTSKRMGTLPDFLFTQVFLRKFQDGIGLFVITFVGTFRRALVGTVSKSEPFFRKVLVHFRKRLRNINQSILNACCGVRFQSSGTKWLQMKVEHATTPGIHDIEESFFQKVTIFGYWGVLSNNLCT